jgi:hypothetical protein
MRNLVLAAAAAVLLAMGAPLSASAAPAQTAVQAASEDHAQQMVAHASKVFELLNESSDSIAKVDSRQMLQYQNPAVFKAFLNSLDQAKAQAQTASRALNAQPDWIGSTREDQMVGKATRDARVFAASVITMIDDIKRVALAIQGGDKAALQTGLDLLARNSRKLVEGQALNLRTRAALLNEDDPSYHQMEAMARIYDGMAQAMRYSFREAPPKEVAARVRETQTKVREAVEDGRRALAFEAQGSSLLLKVLPAGDKVLGMAKTSQELDTQIFASLERSADILQQMAGKLDVAATRISLGPDFMRLAQEEAAAQELVGKQLALADQALDAR